MTVTLPNTTKGITDANNFADAYANDLALKTAVDAVQATVAGTGTDIPDSGLASPNNAAYRTIEKATGYVAGSGGSAATYLFGANGSLILASPGTSAAAHVLYFDDADYTVGSLSQKLRVRAQCLTGGSGGSAAPGITATVGLYPVSSVGGTATTLAYTLGTVTSGSTVVFTTPSANTTNQGNSGDFSAPADGYYALGVALSGAVSSGASVGISAHLQTRSV